MQVAPTGLFAVSFLLLTEYFYRHGTNQTTGSSLTGRRNSKPDNGSGHRLFRLSQSERYYRKYYCRPTSEFHVSSAGRSRTTSPISSWYSSLCVRLSLQLPLAASSRLDSGRLKRKRIFRYGLAPTAEFHFHVPGTFDRRLGFRQRHLSDAVRAFRCDNRWNATRRDPNNLNVSVSNGLFTVPSISIRSFHRR